MIKTKLLPTVLLIPIVLLFANFSLDENRTFIFSFIEEEPSLPDVPFDYSDIEFPMHLVSDTIESGYEAGEIDALAFDDITDEGATLGRVLFYDKKLSAQENISCASCHDQQNSFAENLAFSEGTMAPTKRNSMHLNDIAWSNNATLFWDMSQTDIHTMIKLPLLDENEIGADMEEVVWKLSDTKYYPSLFAEAFGDANITEERIVEALVQFLESMVTFNSRFDQEANRNFAGFTLKEEMGKNLFLETCTVCHSEGSSPAFFGDIFPGLEGESLFNIFPFLFNNGIAKDENDKGVGEWQSGFDDLFKVPTLRNIAHTGPYMHDGRFTTLEEVLDHYSDEVEENEWSGGFIPPGGFSFDQEQKDALLAFLHTLSDESFLTNEKWSDPFNPVSNEESNELEEDIVISPNPFSNHSDIKINGAIDDEYALTIFDIAGKIVFTDKIVGRDYFLLKKNLPSGMYTMELVKEGKKKSSKLVIQ